MVDELIRLDKDFFIFLNGLGSSPFDNLWLMITKQFNWAPFFIAIFYLLQRKIGWKNIGIVILFLALLITATDQITNLFKNGFQRLRPCSDPEINEFIRIVKSSKTFSFFSGHASNSTASTVFIFLIIRTYYKHTYLLFLFPLIFAYSRIYLGLHFPLDIASGYVFGIIIGFIFYKLYCLFIKKTE
ncbi:phosphatase PAP2 family protein [uncultured Flavobacterium sp.]|uniref:phosphatase PAP2 family protein n=1 Tax=uncultured Flavobacterium sp. TaxID=165435 RepID=UPI0030CA170D